MMLGLAVLIGSNYRVDVGCSRFSIGSHNRDMRSGGVAIRDNAIVFVRTPGVDRYTGVLSIVDARRVRYQDIKSLLRDATLDQRIPQDFVFPGGA